MENLYKKLLDYSQTDYYAFHMPGHKRQMNAYPMKKCYQIDITEIEGFDDLHHADGILAEGMKRAAALYRSEQTYYLVNGSTCGILAAVSAVVRKRGKILIARNSHKAAYHALFLRELHPVFLYPQIEESFHVLGGIEPQEVEKALNREEEIQAVFITSPTYDGIVSDIEGIAEIAHRKGIPLIVDEAHGAHFGFHSAFPKSAINSGADVVIHSLHKTLPAMTQSALLHVNGKLIDNDNVQKYLNIYQSSSPSYLLMSGIDECISLLETEGTDRFEQLKDKLALFYESAKNLQKLRIMQKDIIGQAGIEAIDIGKILISTENTSITGKELSQLLLHRYHLQMEMAAENYVLGIATIMDSEEGFERLGKALLEIDKTLSFAFKNSAIKLFQNITEAKLGMELYEAEETAETEVVMLSDSGNRISSEYIYLYPPGIPLVIPGEVIQETAISLITEYWKQGFVVQGITDLETPKIKVIRDINLCLNM